MALSSREQLGTPVLSLELYNASRESFMRACFCSALGTCWVSESSGLGSASGDSTCRCVPVAALSPSARVTHDPSPPLTFLTAWLHYEGCRSLVLGPLDPESWSTGHGITNRCSFPWGRLFLRLSAFLGVCSSLSVAEALWVPLFYVSMFIGAVLVQAMARQPYWWGFHKQSFLETQPCLSMFILLVAALCYNRQRLESLRGL